MSATARAVEDLRALHTELSKFTVATRHTAYWSRLRQLAGVIDDLDRAPPSEPAPLPLPPRPKLQPSRQQVVRESILATDGRVIAVEFRRSQ